MIGRARIGAAIAASASFLVTFGLLAWVLSSVDRAVAHRNLAAQAEAMLRGVRDGATRASLELRFLPRVEELGCETGTSAVLAHRVFENPYVRWLAVAESSQILCRSAVIGIDLAGGTIAHRLDAQWSLLTARVLTGQGNMIIALSRDEQWYLALLEPLLFDFHSRVNCRDCVSYELAIGGEPALVMRVGQTGRPYAVEHTIVRRERQVDVTLSVFANQDYLDEYRAIGRIPAFLVAASAAIAVALAAWRSMMEQRSVRRLLYVALRRRVFVPYYQPIVDTRDGRVLGAEALLRWSDGIDGDISPAHLAALAEDSGLIGPITDQLLDQVLADIQVLGWRGTHRYISINVAPAQLADRRFVDGILGRLAAERLPGRNLSIEITERHRFTDLTGARQALAPLVAAGIDIKLDDAGTGFGGFAYVQELPIGTMKIDKMFVDTLHNPTDAKRLVLDAIIQFGKLSKLDMIAEGVETPEQIELLAEAGVYAIQGYVHARPMPRTQFIAWIANWRTRQYRKAERPD